MNINLSWLLNYKDGSGNIILIASATFFTLLLLASISLSIFYKPKLTVAQNYKRSWIKHLNYCVLFGFVVLFSRWQFLPFLGSRLLYLLVFIFLVLGTIYLIFYKFTVYRKKYILENQAIILEKYRP